MSWLSLQQRERQAENERAKMALAGKLGPAARRAEQDRAWCHRVSVHLPIDMDSVLWVFRRFGEDRLNTLKHFTDRGCVFPPDIHADARAAVRIHGGPVSAEFSQPTQRLNLPDGRSVVVPIEVREDGIYALIDQETRDLIEYRFISPVSEAPTFAAGRGHHSGTVQVTLNTEGQRFLSALMDNVSDTAPPPRRTGKRAQRRMNKPWAGAGR